MNTKYYNKDLHLLITSLCNRNCEYCCNKQYDLNDVPYVTDEELSNVKNVFLTGGEPFMFSNPCRIARHLQLTYHNIENIIVYTNALALAEYLKTGRKIYYITGVTVSVKHEIDRTAFENIIIHNEQILNLPNNRLYVFPSFEDTYCPDEFTKMRRDWQKCFVPAQNSFFRKI